MLLDINEKPSDIITAVQNDTNSRYLDVNLYDNGVPINLEGCEVKIFMNKPENGGEIWNDGVITEAENGRCEFLLTTEALAKMGHLQVQISIWKDNEEILSSQIFEIIVTKSLLGESSVESSNEYGTLVVLFQNLYEAYDLMTTMVQNIGKPDKVAAQYDLATMWQAWEFLVAYMKGDLTDKIDEAIANASIQGVLDLIGKTTDVGGSNVAGTVMAKLNGLFDKSNKISTSLTKHLCSASSDVLKTVVSSEISTTKESENNALSLGKFMISGLDGTLRIAVSLKDSGSSGSTTLAIYRNDEKIESVYVTGTTYATKTAELTVGDGDIIEFKMYTGYPRTGYCNLLTICGMVTEVPIGDFFVEG